MLARVEKYNRKAEEIIKEGRERLSEKMRFTKIDGMSRLARCDKLWKKKNNEARREEDRVKVGDEEQQQQDEDQVGAEDEEQQQRDGDQEQQRQ